MAEPVLVTVRDLTTSRYAQLVENVETPLRDILARAEAAIQSRIGFSVLPTEYTESWRASGQRLFVRRRPIVSISSLQRRPNILYTWETVDPLRYTFEPDPGYIEVFTAVSGYEVRITYTAGIGTLPEDLREAILLQAVLFAAQDFELYGSGDSREPGYVAYFARDIDKILAPYKQTATVWH